MVNNNCSVDLRTVGSNEKERDRNCKTDFRKVVQLQD
ncbi:hypothetical protein SLEP1_g26427 [Rubroshorea leprosula]|uniref:Uncharacterized protein n=1 Tax=Rubroshorea leprosula TaxID=152421 RepID=A0AAV5JPW0_9ROSI|nr:hypothetical protein SLEP1_g26427 [Rubroshorea leprosula]